MNDIAVNILAMRDVRRDKGGDGRCTNWWTLANELWRITLPATGDQKRLA